MLYRILNINITSAIEKKSILERCKTEYNRIHKLLKQKGQLTSVIIQIGNVQDENAKTIGIPAIHT